MTSYDTISQRSVRARRLPAFIGQQYDTSHNNEEIDFVNAHPQATQLTTLTVNASADNTDYEFQVNGVPVKFRSLSTGNTTTTIAAGLAAAANASPLIRGQVKASSNAAVVSLESIAPGIAFTVTESDTRIDAPVAVRAAAEASAIPFGRLCIRGAESSVSPYGNRLGRLASSAGLTAHVVEITATALAATIPTHLSIEVEGQVFTVTRVGPGGGDTNTALATAIKTLLDASDLNDWIETTRDAAVLTLTARVPGVTFRVLSVGTSLAVTDITEGDDINELALGVSLRTYDEEGNEYPANAGAAAMKRGGVWVEAAAAVASGGKVYVHLDGANAGKLYGVGGANRALLKNAKWFKDRSADGLAVVECNF
jgi:hypothetical protein